MPEGPFGGKKETICSDSTSSPWCCYGASGSLNASLATPSPCLPLRALWSSIPALFPRAATLEIALGAALRESARVRRHAGEHRRPPGRPAIPKPSLNARQESVRRIVGGLLLTVEVFAHP